MNLYPDRWTGIVSSISAEVVGLLSAASLPPLGLQIDGSAGAIEVGPQFVAENGGPPRIVFVPKGGPLKQTRDVTSRTFNGTYPEKKAIHNNPPIAWYTKTFEVQCWGVNMDASGNVVPDPAKDYDAAQCIADVVLQACQIVAPNLWKTTTLQIDPGGPNLVRFGRVVVFDLEIQTPITSQVFAESNAPSNVSPVAIVDINGTFGVQQS